MPTSITRITAALAVAAAACLPSVAHADVTRPGVKYTARDTARAANVILTFGAPQLAPDGSAVTWSWTVTNTGNDRAEEVVVVNQLAPAGKLQEISKPCKSAAGGKITCDYGSLTPGASLNGWVRTSAPTSVGSVHISGEVTWVDCQLLPGAKPTPAARATGTADA